MAELLKNSLTIPAAPSYGVPVASREIHVRVKEGETKVLPVPAGSTVAGFEAPAGARCFVELVNTLEGGEGRKEQDRLDFVVGNEATSSGGMSVCVAQPAEDLPADPASQPAADDTDGHALDHAEDATSAVAELNATDAIDAISRMRSTDRLEKIVLNDKRVSVQHAAQKRLDALAE